MFYPVVVLYSYTMSLKLFKQYHVIHPLFERLLERSVNTSGIYRLFSKASNIWSVSWIIARSFEWPSWKSNCLGSILFLSKKYLWKLLLYCQKFLREENFANFANRSFIREIKFPRKKFFRFICKIKFPRKKTFSSFANINSTIFFRFCQSFSIFSLYDH